MKIVPNLASFVCIHSILGVRLMISHLHKMKSAAMKIVYFVLIAFLASTTTVASLRSLPEVEEFAFEYDSESEDTSQSDQVRKTSSSVAVQSATLYHLIHAP
jgi:hypothetical protein